LPDFAGVSALVSVSKPKSHTVDAYKNMCNSMGYITLVSCYISKIMNCALNVISASGINSGKWPG